VDLGLGFAISIVDLHCRACHRPGPMVDSAPVAMNLDRMNGEVPLRGWKEIAARLGTSERTVRRWEVARGLPIHRVNGAARDAVFAWPAELTEWLSRKSISPKAPGPQEVTPEEADIPLRGVSADNRQELSSLRPGSRPRRLRRPGILFAAASCVLLVLLGFAKHPSFDSAPRWASSTQRPSGTAQGTGEVALIVTGRDGSKTMIAIPLGDAGRVSGPGGQPIALIRPRPIENGRRMEVEIVFAPGSIPTDHQRPPLVLRLDPEVEVQVLEPFPFNLEWPGSPADSPRR